MRRIAVIDDDENSRLAMVALLRSLGFEAQSYPSAHSYMADTTKLWGCIISDVQMPEMDGFELLATVRRWPQAPPVILTTAFSMPNARERASAAGATWFFEKPVDEGTLLRRLTAILLSNT